MTEGAGCVCEGRLSLRPWRSCRFSAWRSRHFAHTELVFWTVQSGTGGHQQLLLRYSEPIDGRFLTVAVLDRQGNGLQTSGVTIDQRRLTDGYLSLGKISPGIYTVAWWTRAQDGDPSNGSFVLGLGTSVSPVALLPPVGARDPAIQPAMFWQDTVFDTILHWFSYLAVALLVGGLGFAFLVWRPAFRKVAGSVPAGDDSRLRELEDSRFRDLPHVPLGCSCRRRLLSFQQPDAAAPAGGVRPLLDTAAYNRSEPHPPRAIDALPPSPVQSSCRDPLGTPGPCLAGPASGRVSLALLLAMLLTPRRRRRELALAPCLRSRRRGGADA